MFSSIATTFSKNQNLNKCIFKINNGKWGEHDFWIILYDLMIYLKLFEIWSEFEKNSSTYSTTWSLL